MDAATKVPEPTRELDQRPRTEPRGEGAISLLPPAYGIGPVDSGDAPVQRFTTGPLAFEDPARIRSAALQGIRGPGGPLPYFEHIQRSFGRFDLSQVVTHTDDAARASARDIGADAFAIGRHVAFDGSPSLRIAAHEAAHVIQQRGQVQLAGGVGQLGDLYERHADAVAELVVQGQSAEGLLAELAGDQASGSGSDVVQRNVAVDIASASGDFVWTYMQRLIAAHGVEASLAGLLKTACTYLIDQGIRVTGLDSYLAIMNPYIAVLQRIKSAISSIPEPILVLLNYGIGWGIRKFSNAYMYGAIKESHINTLLIEGGNVVSQIGKIIDFLGALSKPSELIYKAVWSAYEAVSTTGMSSLGSLIAAEVGAIEDEDDAPDQLVDANLGWFWLAVENPEIARWQQQSTERGGLQIVSRFGVKVFGNVMGTDKLVVRVPYGGDWEAAFTSLSLVSKPIKLGGLFEAGPIALQKVRVGPDGLRFLHLTIDRLAFGKVVEANDLTLTYRASDKSPDAMLQVRGAAKLNAFGHQIAGRIGLDLDTAGNFAGGSVQLVVPETFTLIKDRLFLSNPQMWAKWSKQGGTDIGIGGDLEVKLIDTLDFASTGTTLRYSSAKGFEGAVERIWLNIPVHQGGTLHFELKQGVIDKDGFSAKEVSLVYAYGEQDQDKGNKDKDKDQAQSQDASTPSQDAQPKTGKLSTQRITEIMPGFNIDWIKTVGLDALVVNLSAKDVVIGRQGLDVGQLRKEITKFKAHLFGLGAEFDGTTGRGAITGKIAHKVPLPSVAAKVPVVPPAVTAQLGIRPSLEFGAGLTVGLQRKQPDQSTPHLHPWALDGAANFAANATVSLEAGVGVGIPYLAEVSAGLFAEAKGALETKAAVKGTVLWNDSTHQLSLPSKPEDKPRAELSAKVGLSAAIGAQVRAQLFYFIDTQLWAYRFVEWKLGEWELIGKIVATEAGGYELVTSKAGFAGDKGQPKTQPVVEKNVVTVAALIDDLYARGKKIEDVHQLWRVVHDLQDPTSQMDFKKRLELYKKLDKLNGTTLDLDAISTQVLGLIRQRRDDDEGGLSLLMSEAEWIKYSTTPKLFGSDPTERKSIEPIDKAIAAYHRQGSLPERKKILERLINELIPAYTSQYTASRKPMADKLWTDAQRELARISG